MMRTPLSAPRLAWTSPWIAVVALALALARGLPSPAGAQAPSTPATSATPAQDPPATDPAKPKPRRAGAPDPDDPLADRFDMDGVDAADIDGDAAKLQETLEPVSPPSEPGALEEWLRLGKLKIRERLEYRFRRFTSRGFIDGFDMTIPRGTERDQELRNLIEIETFGLGADNVNAYVNFEYRKDTDGTRYHSFQQSILTTYGDRDLLRLNSAYVEVVGALDILRVRVGRQSTHEAHPVTFDGVSAKVDRVRLFGAPAEFRTFAGVIVSDFSNLRRDVVAGGGVTVHPTPNLTLELRDTRYVRNRLEAEARWSPIRDVTLTGTYGFYDAKGRDARFEAGYTVDPVGLQITAGCYDRYAHDFRLDFLTGQSARHFDRDYFFLPELAPYRELYVRVEQPIGDHFAIGGEFVRHRLRNGRDESPYDTDYDQIGGFADAEFGALRLRSEMRYYHARRDDFVQVVPRLPFPTVFASIIQGETDHVEYHANATATIARGWSIHAGMIWHRVNYSDALRSVNHEQFADFRLELTAQLQANVTLRVAYDHTRDADYFNPYFERFQAFSWILDVRM